jgi:Flp pilus assembly protein TadG
MMLVFGVVQFGLLYNRQQALHASAREGARLAAVPSSTSTEISQRALAALDGVPMSGTPTVTITPTLSQPCENRRGETVKVTVTVPTTIEIPLWGTESKTLTGKGEFRCE